MHCGSFQTTLESWAEKQEPHRSVAVNHNTVFLMQMTFHDEFKVLCLTRCRTASLCFLIEKKSIWDVLIFQHVATLSTRVVNNADEYVIFTWAQCSAGHSLEGRALTEGSSIQRGRIGTAARSSLPTPPTLSITL